jgi:cobalt-zinc-cadmium efflux system membrane fusion protein
MLSESKGAAEKAPDGSIDMPPERIVAQGIEVAPVEKGVLARVLVVPGTITLDMDRVARVPGRVVGTVTQMRKRLGDAVTRGEVVAVLDSREVADAKSEYLTASVFFDLKKTLFERAQTLWAKKISAEQQYLQARETFLEAELRLDLAKQKLSALNIDPAEVAKAAKQESAPNAGASTLREYQIRCLIAGRVIERKVDVGSLVGNQGDPPDLYTIADLSVVWVELAVPTADLDMVEDGQEVKVASGQRQRQTRRRTSHIHQPARASGYALGSCDRSPRQQEHDLAPRRGRDGQHRDQERVCGCPRPPRRASDNWRWPGGLRANS